MDNGLLFEMTVKDIYQFKEGRTVFAGKLNADMEMIPPCIGKIFVHGVLKQEIDILGERLAEKAGVSLRSVETLSPIKLKDFPLENDDMILKGYTVPPHRARLLERE